MDESCCGVSAVRTANMVAFLSHNMHEIQGMYVQCTAGHVDPRMSIEWGPMGIRVKRALSPLVCGVCEHNGAGARVTRTRADGVGDVRADGHCKPRVTIVLFRVN